MAKITIETDDDISSVTINFTYSNGKVVGSSVRPEVSITNREVPINGSSSEREMDFDKSSSPVVTGSGSVTAAVLDIPEPTPIQGVGMEIQDI